MEIQLNGRQVKPCHADSEADRLRSALIKWRRENARHRENPHKSPKPNVTEIARLYGVNEARLRSPVLIFTGDSTSIKELSLKDRRRPRFISDILNLSIDQGTTPNDLPEQNLDLIHSPSGLSADSSLEIKQLLTSRSTPNPPENILDSSPTSRSSHATKIAAIHNPDSEADISICDLRNIRHVGEMRDYSENHAQCGKIATAKVQSIREQIELQGNKPAVMSLCF